MNKFIYVLLSAVIAGCGSAASGIEPGSELETGQVSIEAKQDRVSAISNRASSASASSPVGALASPAERPSFQCTAGRGTPERARLAATTTPRRNPMYRVPPGALRPEVIEAASAHTATPDPEQQQ
jgi:hypothetical protein